jgi:hypothetical protein
MRVITLPGSFELWGGRRLYVDGNLYALPKGAMFRLANTLHFGSVNKTSMRIGGSDKMITALQQAIIEMERPNAFVRFPKAG